MPDQTHHHDPNDPHERGDVLDVEALLRSLTPDDLVAPEAPPASIWAGIQAELGATSTSTSTATVTATSTATVTATSTATGDGSSPSSTWSGSPPAVVSLDEHRAARRGVSRMMLAAAVAALVVAGAVAVVATRGGDDAAVVATARLAWDSDRFDPLGADASATAQLVEGDDGYELVLTDARLPSAVEDTADLELWMISTDANGEITDIQPVALVDPASPGTYAVPAGIDPATYSVVDISIEPRDGDAAHSGKSILRGTLQA